MRIEIGENYCENSDITFLMEYIYDEKGNLRRMTCVGWYAGEPNAEDTKHYTYRGICAVYEEV